MEDVVLHYLLRYMVLHFSRVPTLPPDTQDPPFKTLPINYVDGRTQGTRGRKCHTAFGTSGPGTFSQKITAGLPVHMHSRYDET
jgi:hypothetical protein